MSIVYLLVYYIQQVSAINM